MAANIRALCICLKVNEAKGSRDRVNLFDGREMNRHGNLKVLARFRPRVVGDLMPGLEKAVGTAAVFSYTRQMDEDDPIPGEWILKTDDERFGDFWIPESDLEIIRICSSRRLSH